MGITTVWLAFFVLLLRIGGASAAVDGWVLALSWRPGFCAGQPDVPGCLKATGPRLTLHGLWPESSQSDDESFCAVTPEARAIDHRDTWCQLPVPALSPRTSAVLDGVMPDRLACLDRHEWLRHGTCSGLSADEYFSTAARLATRAGGLTLGRALGSQAGAAMTLKDLMQAVASDFGLDKVGAFAFVCDRRNTVPHLVEIRISLTTDGPRSFPAPAALHIPAFRMARSCPADKMIRIDGAR